MIHKVGTPRIRFAAACHFGKLENIAKFSLSKKVCDWTNASSACIEPASVGCYFDLVDFAGNIGWFCKVLLELKYRGFRSFLQCDTLQCIIPQSSEPAPCIMASHRLDLSAAGVAAAAALMALT